MARPGEDWRTYYRWEKRQILEGGGAPDGPNLTQTLRAQWKKWKARPDRKEYVELIRWIEGSESRIRKLNHHLKTSTQAGVTRYALRDARNSKVRLLNGLRARLVSLRKRQAWRDNTGKMTTMAASRRNVARMIEQADEEVRRMKLESTGGTADEYFDNLSAAPADLQEYITRSCEEMMWMDEPNPYCTEQDMAARLQTEVRHAQFYQDLDRIKWSRKRSAQQSVRKSREHGEVECDGHPFDPDRGDLDGDRDELVDAWNTFLGRYRTVFGAWTTVLPPLWVMTTAKARAEMNLDHNGISVYPPDAGTDSVSIEGMTADVKEVLEVLNGVEDNFYLVSPVFHESLDTAIDLYIRKGGYRTEVSNGEPPSRPVSIPEAQPNLRPGETLEMVAAGRRALRHIWESRIRSMMNARRSVRRVTREMWYYRRALALFDSDNEKNAELGERHWITDRSHVLLKEPARVARTCNASRNELATRRPAIPGTIECSDLRSKWVMKGALGEGSSGTIFLWVRYDRSGKIVGRMATKETQYRASQWRDPRNWRPDDNSRPGRVPREAYIQGLFADLPRNSSKIVELFGTRVYRTHWLVRLYMEFCSLGTAGDLIMRYQRNATLASYKASGYVAEFGVWALFESLAIAAYAMEKGHLPDASGPDSELEVVHQDIRLPNVFLTNNTGTACPGCPVFKIGDFGNAEQTHLADPRNPQDIRAPGLPDTAAPEQITEGDHETGMLLSSKTNIWSCGRIAMAAMGASTLEARDLDFVADLSPYSATLQALALRCLRTDPADRPSPEELLKEIRNHVEHVPSRPTEWWRLLDQGMRNLVRGLMGVSLPARDELSMKWRSPMNEEDRLDVQVDDYRLGFVDATMGRAGNFM